MQNSVKTIRRREIPYLEQLERARKIIHKDYEKYLNTNEDIIKALDKKA